MHEFSIAQNMVDIARKELIKAKGSKVIKMEIAIGKISGVVPDALCFAFPQAAKGTELENCELKVTEIQMRTECNCCGSQNTMEEFLMLCNVCHNSDVKIINGKEILITTMEIE